MSDSDGYGVGKNLAGGRDKMAMLSVAIWWGVQTTSNLAIGTMATLESGNMIKTCASPKTLDTCMKSRGSSD